MRILGGFAVLVGGLELSNTILAAGAVGRGGGSGTGTALALVVGIVSVLLLISGIALVARPRESIAFARGSALATLIAFALVAALRPGFSMASMLLGIVFPVVMLLVIVRRWPARAASR